MSSKEIALDMIRRLPDEATLLDIAQELEFLAGIRQATDELDRGEGVSAEEVLKRIPTWAIAGFWHAARGVPEIDSDEFGSHPNRQ